VSTEHQRVAMLAELFATAQSSGVQKLPRDVLLGIGDDAALLAGQDETLVWSIDAQVDEVHFKRAWVSLADIGYRATMAAMSDLAAMGARPLGMLSALTLPPSFSDDELLALASGQRDAAIVLGTTVLGGNMARGETLSITTTVLGVAARPVLRSGAEVSDEIWLAGHVGRAACGLALFMRDVDVERSEACGIARAAFLRPLALIDDGRNAAAAGATAMIDISDGLAADLGRLAADSRVAVVLDARTLDDAIVSDVAKLLGMAPRDRILEGGEDYALVATLRPGAKLPGFRMVGVTRGDLAPGVWLDDGGTLTRIEERGFDHFADAK
jgi:thiamine-monophosphate kinase